MTPDRFVLLMTWIVAFFATPGPATISIVANGATYGMRRTVPYIAGLLVGFVFVFLAADLGLAFLLTRYPAAEAVLRGIAIVYMLYLAWRIWRTDGIALDGARPLSLLNGVMLNVVNPKAYVAALAILAQFGGPGQDWLVGAIILVSAAVIDVGLAFLADRMAGTLTRRTTIVRLNRVLAVLLVVSIVWVLIA